MRAADSLSLLNRRDCPDCRSEGMAAGLRIEIAEHLTCVACDARSMLLRALRMPKHSSGNERGKIDGDLEPALVGLSDRLTQADARAPAVLFYKFYSRGL